LPYSLRLIAAAVIVLAALAPGSAHAVTLPPGFQESIAIAGFNDPMDLEIAPGGDFARGHHASRIS